MSFRNYQDVRSVCICCESARELENRLDELQQQFDFVDLQFSTHFDNSFKQERFCVLLLAAPKGELNGK